MTAERATFEIRPDGVNRLDDIGSVAITCLLEWDREQRSWRASDEHGHEAFADYKPVAALRLFTSHFEDVSL